MQVRARRTRRISPRAIETKTSRCWFFFSRASLMFFTRRDSDRRLRFFHPPREARSASSARASSRHSLTPNLSIPNRVPRTTSRTRIRTNERQSDAERVRFTRRGLAGFAAHGAGALRDAPGRRRVLRAAASGAAAPDARSVRGLRRRRVRGVALGLAGGAEQPAAHVHGLTRAAQRRGAALPEPPDPAGRGRRPRRRRVRRAGQRRLGGGFGTVGGGFDAPIGGGGRGPIGAAPIGAIGAAPIGGGARGLAPSARGRWAPRRARRARAPPAPAGGPSAPAPAAPSQPPTYASAMRVQAAAAAKAGSYAAAGASGKPAPSPAASPSPAAAAAAAVPEALLAMLQSSTAGAEGVGVIATSASVASGYVLRAGQAVVAAAGAAGDQPAGRALRGGPAEILPDDRRCGEPERLEPRRRGGAQPAARRAPGGCAGQRHLRRHRGERRRRGEHRRAGKAGGRRRRPERRRRARAQRHRVARHAVPLRAHRGRRHWFDARRVLRPAPRAGQPAAGSGEAVPLARLRVARPRARRRRRRRARRRRRRRRRDQRRARARRGRGARRPGTGPPRAPRTTALRAACARARRPAAAEAAAAASAAARGDFGAKARSPPAAGRRELPPRDSICGGCRAHNPRRGARASSASSARRAARRRLRAGGERRRVGGAGELAGHRICQSCCAHNFASRAVCSSAARSPPTEGGEMRGGANANAVANAVANASRSRGGWRCGGAEGVKRTNVRDDEGDEYKAVSS